MAISNLLFRYDCVVVPELGILAHKIPAKVQESKNAFYPPSSDYHSTTQLQTNDGVLANHISEIEQIYENATKIVNIVTS